MKHIVKFLAVLLCLGLLLAGCGEAPPEETTTAPTTTAATTLPTTLPQEDTLSLEDSIWDLDGEVYTFYPDGTLLVDLSDGTLALGSYTWDGKTGTAEALEITIAMAWEDGSLTLSADGEEYAPEYVGVPPVWGGLGIEDSVWTLEDAAYSFFPDGTVTANDGVDFYIGSYDWDTDGGHGTLWIEDITMAIAMPDQTLLIQGEDGLYYSMTDGGLTDGYLPQGGAEDSIYGVWLYSAELNSYLYFDGEDTAETGDFNSGGSTCYDYSYDGYVLRLYDEETKTLFTGYVDSDGDVILEDVEGYFTWVAAELGNWDFVNNGDGTLRFSDYDRNVAVTFPAGMQVNVEGIGDGTDAIIVGDGNGGYVIGDNVTNEWYDYEGTDEDYLLEYINSYLPYFFDTIYGEWEDCTAPELLESDAAGRMATVSMNIWNDDFDINVIVLLYDTSGDNIMVKIFFAPYDNDAQLQVLWDEVVRLTEPG